MVILLEARLPTLPDDTHFGFAEFSRRAGDYGLAMALAVFLKWIEDRRENLMAANHSRQQRHHARVAVDSGGRVLALEDEFYLDQGAYVRTHGARVLEMTISMLP